MTRRIHPSPGFWQHQSRKALPFFALLKKENTFEWMPECEVAFMDSKSISPALILRKPEVSQPLYLYLLVSNATIACALI